ncbi:MAG: GNAT family N-acetyltransferase [Clostridiales bacterium]|jgi:putative acetyltransferase|nr:GNAT family N-acetyltransferase [Clostridiales bacterium]
MIRKAEIKDISRIAEILIFAKRLSYREIFQNDRVTFGEMQVYPLIQEFLERPELLSDIIVFDDEFVKGMARIEVTNPDDGITYLEIVELYMDPFFRGLGIGGKMISWIQDYGKKNNANNMFLWVLEKNTNARGFYERHRFMYTGERKLEEGTTEYIVKYCLEAKV